MWPGESEKMLLFELKACVKETVCCLYNESKGCLL